MSEQTWQEALAAPFAPSEIQFRPGATRPLPADRKYPLGAVKLAQKLAYIDARDVMYRLDLVVGVGNWEDTYRVIDEDAHAVECTLTISTPDETLRSKCDVGYPNSASDGDEKEPLKAAYSDAFKRAAVKWGIGRHLYDMPREWTPINQYGRFIS